jgi:hypothetical protein
MREDMTEVREGAEISAFPYHGRWSRSPVPAFRSVFQSQLRFVVLWFLAPVVSIRGSEPQASYWGDPNHSVQLRSRKKRIQNPMKRLMRGPKVASLST